LIALLDDDSPRVQYFAAQSLGKLADPRAIAPLLALLERNADRDAVLRHAAVMGLTGSAGGNPSRLVERATHRSSAARIGVLLSLRRLASPEVSLFLNDADPRLVVEAARAIHDLPIEAALPQLAALITRQTSDDALIRRVLNANYRLGTQEAAEAIAAYAARAEAPDAMRIEALDMLAAWSKPSGRDRVLGMWRPLPERPAADAADAARGKLAHFFTGSERVRARAAEVATALGIQEVIPVLRDVLADSSQPPGSRAGALASLVSLKDPEAEQAARTALNDSAAVVRASARDALNRLSTNDAVELLANALTGGECIERQAALAALGGRSDRPSREALAQALDRLLAGEFPADSALDLLEAAGSRNSSTLREKLDAYAAKNPKDDPLADYRACLEGGDAERGRRLFFERSELSCVRCHKVGGTGGDVGPELTKIATDKEGAYLLESIVVPNKAIAKNFETVVVLDADGVTHTGILKQENAEALILMTPEGKLVTIPQDQIEARKEGKSSMPEDLLKHVSKLELRDLVAFLSSLK
jgi:quinoprotein glucose dehydrogenase